MKWPLLFFVFLLGQVAVAEIDPLYKECMQRGYSIDGEYCVFPDSSKCLLEQFNVNICGEEWFTDDYCVPENEPVWDAERCCDGLVAYLPDEADGQPKCMNAKIVNAVDVNFWLVIGSIVIIVLATVLHYNYRKKQS